MLYVKPLQYKELIRTSETSEAIKITLSVDVGNSKIATKLQKKLSEGYLVNVEILNDSVVTGTVDLQNAVVAASAYKRAIEKAVY
ncbi:hypothetical protein ABVF61_02355 [Roseibium sp. HPY-6]|uniref:hypothetical protein n=1 Tax=Roseibium sp. HPY-6 TaxID=3229852 RepID=UPI00338F65E3